MARKNASSAARVRAARALEAHFEKIFADYERRLEESSSLLLIGEVYTREQLREQAYAALEDAGEALRGAGRSPLEIEDRLYQALEESRGEGVIHPDESLRAVAALSGAALSVVAEELSEPPAASPVEFAEVAHKLQESVTERMARAALVSYVDYLLHKVHESSAEERRRIGRELHDRVAHSMAVVNQSIELYGVLKDRDPAKAATKIKGAQEMAKEALHSTRDLSYMLSRPEAGDGMYLALSDFMESGLPPEVSPRLTFSGDDSVLSPHIRDQVFVILREGIRNAASHAGCRKLSVEVSTTPAGLTASVTDDGRGFVPGDPDAASGSAASGNGLKYMGERVALLGGVFNLDSAPGKGTTLEIYVPLRGVERDGR